MSLHIDGEGDSVTVQYWTVTYDVEDDPIASPPSTISHSGGIALDEGVAVLDNGTITLTVTEGTPAAGYHGPLTISWSDDGNGNQMIFTITTGIHILATVAWDENVYEASVTLTLDTDPWDDRTVTLRLDGTGTSVPLTETAPGVYKADVVNGTYVIFIDGKATGVPLVISGTPNSVIAQYWTVTYDIEDEPSAFEASTISHSGTYVIGTDDVLAVLNNGTITLIVTEGTPAVGYHGPPAIIWSAGPGADNTETFTIAAKIHILATVAWVENVYEASVTLRLDDDLWNGQTVTLNDDAYETNETGDGVYTLNVTNGTYVIYVSGVSTGIPLHIDGEGDSAAVQYWTVTYLVEDMPATSEASTISHSGTGIITTDEGYAVLNNGTITLTVTEGTSAAGYHGPPAISWSNDSTGNAEEFTIAAKIHILATVAWVENVYETSVTLRLDDDPWNYQAVTLNDDAYEMDETGDGVYTLNVPNGTYEIYVNGGPTGMSLHIDGEGDSAILYYYTVTLNKGTGISDVLLNDESFTTDVFLSGTSVAADASVAAAYTWVNWTVTYGSAEFTKERDLTLDIVGTVNITANAVLTTYAATVTVTLDGEGSAGRMVTLHDTISGDLRYTLTFIADGTYSCDVLPGTYDVQIDTKDVGKDITITDSPVSVTAEYFTLTLNHDPGTDSVSGGGVFPAGSCADISAVLKNDRTWVKWSASTGPSDDVSLQNTAVTVNRKLTLTATTTDTLYTVTVNLNKDSAPWDNRTVKLNDVYLLVDNDDGVYVSPQEIMRGTYTIWADGESTGVTVDVGFDKANEKMLDFFTLTLNKDPGVGSIIGNGTFLSGTDTAISATVKEYHTWVKWAASTGPSDDVSLQNTAITMDRQITLTATTTDTLYAVTVNLNKDNAPWDGQTVTLNNGIYALTDDGNGVYVSFAVTHGTYTIWVNGEDTGISVDVGPGVNEETADYFTLALNHDDGVESVSGGGLFLTGTVVPIHVAVKEYHTWDRWVASTGPSDDVFAQNTIVTVNQKLTLTATASATLYTVTVNVNKNAEPWDGQTVTLVNGTSYTLTDDDDGVYVSFAVTHGTYTIWVNGEDTGISVDVEPGVDKKTVDFFTLTLNKGPGVGSVVGGGVFLSGTDTAISATVKEYHTWVKWTASTGPSDDVSLQNTVITIDRKLTLTATAYENVYEATVELTLDGAAWNDRTVTLRLNGTGTPIPTAHADGKYTASVHNGTYEVFINGTGTSVSLRIDGDGDSAILYYYTVTLDKGAGISEVLLNGEPFTTDVFLSGTSVTIDASAAAGYTWVNWTVTGNSAEFAVSPEYAFDVVDTAGITANAVLTTYIVTVTVTLDGEGLTGQMVTLHDAMSGDLRYTLAFVTDGTYSCDVLPGTYDVRVDAKDVGKDITMIDSPDGVTVEYFTLTVIAGAGTSSPAGSGVYLAGVPVSVSVTVDTGWAFSEWTAAGYIDTVPSSDYATIAMPANELTLTAAATPNVYNVTVDVTGADNDAPLNVYHGSSLSFKLTPRTGYDLPLTITIDSGPIRLTEADYDYDNIEGTITIFSGRIIGDVMIDGSAEQKQMTVAVDVKNTTSDERSEVNYGDALEFTMTAIPGYALPSALTVTMGDETLAAADYKWNSTTGVFKIGSVTGDVTVAGSAVLIEYFVTVDLFKDGSPWIGQSMSLNNGDYDLTDADGEYASTVKVPPGTYTIWLNGSSTGTSIDIGHDRENRTVLDYFTLTLEKGTGIDKVYIEGSEFTEPPAFRPGTYVAIDTEMLNGYAWSKWTADPAAFGDVSATDSVIMMPAYALVLTATGTPVTYTTNVLVDNATHNAPDTQLHGDPLSFLITADTGYILPSSLSVSMGGEAVDAMNYTWDIVTGEFEMTHPDGVTGDVIITGAASPVLLTVTGKIYCDKGKPMKGATVHYRFVSVTGTMITAATGPDGTYTIKNVPHGRSVEILDVTLAGYAPQTDATPMIIGAVTDDITGVNFTMEPEHPSPIPWIVTAAAAAAVLAMLFLLILWHRRYVDIIKVHSEDVIIEGKDRARRKKEYVFRVLGPDNGTMRYRVGEEGEWKFIEPDEDGMYILPGEDVTDHITLERR
jgi:hypothetical protein